ncbi:MAG: proline dehydrogenase family protein [Methanoregulaceae archaeon]|nr:proline dehydrogenase family protein [Methanoregulaceae archaeon]
MAGDAGGRWSEPDLHSAIERCRRRNAEGIRCVLNVMGEFSASREESERVRDAYLECLRAVRWNGLDASVSVKLAALGGAWNQTLCRELVVSVLRATAEKRAGGFEIDTEGRNLVPYTIETACACTGFGVPVTVALQAYLDRTSGDLRSCIDQKLRVRIVKGAYLGDTGDFADISGRFRTLAGVLIGEGISFSAGTHDPEIVEWLKSGTERQKHLVEFGFLMGLADETKHTLVKEGWKVSEYIPFGPGNGAYETRRERYLKELESSGRKPVP